MPVSTRNLFVNRLVVAAIALNITAINACRRQTEVSTQQKQELSEPRQANIRARLEEDTMAAKKNKQKSEDSSLNAESTDEEVAKIKARRLSLDSSPATTVGKSQDQQHKTRGDRPRADLDGPTRAVIDSLIYKDNARVGKVVYATPHHACVTANTENAFGGRTGDFEVPVIVVEGQWVALPVERPFRLKENCIFSLRIIAKLDAEKKQEDAYNSGSRCKNKVTAGGREICL